MKAKLDLQPFEAPYQKTLAAIEGVTTLKGNAELKLQLWINRSGELFVQITENSNKETTHSNLLFPVSADTWSAISDQETGKKLSGYNLETGELQLSQNNNDSGFLKAAFLQLLNN